MAKKEKLPKTNASEIEALIERFKGSQLKPGDAELIERLLRTVVMLLDLLERKNLSIKKLKAMIFGPRTEKRQTTGGADEEKSAVSEEKKSESSPSVTEQESGRLSEGSESAEIGEKPLRRGHGRRAASDYSGAKVESCRHENLKAGDPCPDPLCQGRLYDRNEPRLLLQFVGRPLVEATKYEREVLRCAVCLEQYVAPLPEGVADERFDATADATIALMKYGGGLPWHRQAALQRMCGVPLAESVMWERCEALADAALPIYLRLVRLGANGELIHTDDTKVRILSCLKEDEEKKKKGEESRATQTSGLVIESGGHRIALYFSGRHHAGENLEQLLKLRQAGQDRPIQMADALNVNWDHEEEVIEAKCMVHGRRGILEVEELEPVACKVVLDAISEVYRYEAETKGMSQEERLRYHQSKSGPVMEKMKEWIELQFNERLVEPNSSVGRALQYWLNHWEGLTACSMVSHCLLAGLDITWGGLLNRLKPLVSSFHFHRHLYSSCASVTTQSAHL
jgi:transposase